MDILAPCYLWYVANAMGLVVAMAVAAVRITLCNILMMSLVKKLYFYGTLIFLNSFESNFVCLCLI